MVLHLQVKLTRAFIQGLQECPTASPLCLRQAAMALLLRLADGRPPRNRYPQLAAEHGIRTAHVGVAHQARILVYYVDVDRSSLKQARMNCGLFAAIAMPWPVSPTQRWCCR